MGQDCKPTAAADYGPFSDKDMNRAVLPECLSALNCRKTFVLTFLALVMVFLAMDAGTRVALYVTPVWFILLTIGYKLSTSQADEAAVLAEETP